MSSVDKGWEFRGTDLTTLAYNVKALGAPEIVPGRRGENLVVPGKTGRTRTTKYMDQRILALGMQVFGRDSSTGGAMSGSQLWTNLDTLKKLFATDGQGTLKFQHAAGTTRWCMAEVINTVEFAPTGPDSYDFMVEFVMPDPLWYDEQTTTVGPSNVTSSPTNITVANSGTYKSEKAEFTVIASNGDLVNPKLTIDDYYVLYTGTVASGGTLTIDCEDFTATKGTADVTNDITHDGGIVWLPVPTGSNTLAVTADSVGTATVTVTFVPPYI